MPGMAVISPALISPLSPSLSLKNPPTILPTVMPIMITEEYRAAGTAAMCREITKKEDVQAVIMPSREL